MLFILGFSVLSHFIQLCLSRLCLHTWSNRSIWISILLFHCHSFDFLSHAHDLNKKRTHCSLIQRFVNNFFFVLSGCACVQKQENGNHFFVCNMCPPSCDQLVHTSIDFHPKYKGLKRFYAVLLGLWRGVNCALFCFILTFGFRCRTVFRKRLNLSNVVFFFLQVFALVVFLNLYRYFPLFFYIWLFYFFAIQIEDKFSFWVWFRFCLLLVQFIMV